MKKHILFQAFLCLLVICSATQVNAQITLAFQGAEPGDTWPYTITGSSPEGITESTSPSNFVSGTQSLVSGGLSGGGSCLSGGSGNGTSTLNSVAFDNIDISTSSMFARELSFHYGNRFPSCTGTGFDSGENVIFTPIHDGVPQTAITIFTGGGNAPVDINQTVYTYSIPACVGTFGFSIEILLNRNDEFLFVDDVLLTSPQLNAPIPSFTNITGPQQLCSGTTAVYNTDETSGVNYHWFGLPSTASFTTANDTSIADSITVNWGATPVGTYTVSVAPTDACGLLNGDTISLSVTLSQGGAPITITGPDTICAGNTATWTSNYSIGNTWSTSDTTQSISLSQSGTYSLSVLGGCGTSQITQTLTVLPLPLATITASGSLAICPGQSVTLSANTAQNISWTGALITQDITVSAAGEYILSVTNGCGTSNDTVTVSLLPGVVNPTIQSLGNVLCNGASLQLISDQQGGNSWSTGSSNDTITVTSSGTYILSYSNGCATGTDTLVVGTSALDVTIVAAPDSGNAPLATSFTANSDSSISTYQWNIAGLQQSSFSQPNFTFETPGTYTAYVTVTDANGCLAVDSVNVIVLPELPSELSIANCFSPNGDGYNDYFKANALNLANFDIQIFNRWGSLVYSSSSNLPGWDGTSKSNSAVPDATYFYILKATGDDGKIFEKTGSVTLMR